MGLDLIPVLTFSGRPEIGENVNEMSTDCVIVPCAVSC